MGNVDTPEQVKNLTDIVSIDKGHSHNIAAKNDGTVWTWGNNKKGQIGNGKAENESFLVSQVQGITDASAVSAGGEHSVVLKKDGTIWSWGSNEKGQLGDGTNDDRLTPVKVLLK